MPWHNAYVALQLTLHLAITRNLTTRMLVTRSCANCIWVSISGCLGFMSFRDNHDSGIVKPSGIGKPRTIPEDPKHLDPVLYKVYIGILGWYF